MGEHKRSRREPQTTSRDGVSHGYRRIYGLVMDEDEPALFDSTLYLGSLFLSPRLMMAIKIYYLRKLHNPILLIFILTSIPFAYVFWYPIFKDSEMMYYTTGSFMILNQSIYLLYANRAILVMLFGCLETCYLLIHLLIESFTLCFMVSFSPKIVFFTSTFAITQVNAIIIDAFEKGFSGQHRGLLALAKLRKAYANQLSKYHEITPPNFAWLTPPWNPEGIKDPNKLAQHPDFLTNTHILAAQLKRLYEPDSHWPFHIRMWYRIVSHVTTVSRIEALACFFGTVIKTYIYALVAYRVIPVNEDATLTLFGFNWIALEYFRISCSASIVVYMKRLVLLFKYPFRLSTIPRHTLNVPLVDSWSGWMDQHTRRNYATFLCELEKHNSQTQPKPTEPTSKAKQIQDELSPSTETNCTPQLPHLERVGRRSGANGIMSDWLTSKRSLGSLSATKVPIPTVTFSSLGSGLVVELTDSFLSKIVDRKHLQRVIRIISKVSIFANMVWFVSTASLIVLILKFQHLISALAVYGFLISGAGMLPFLLLNNATVCQRTFFEFGTLYSLVNMVSMMSLWCVYISYFEGFVLVIPIVILFGCLFGIFIDAHPIPIHAIAKYLSSLSSQRSGDIQTDYESCLAAVVCARIMSRLTIHPQFPNRKAPSKRFISWTETLPTPANPYAPIQPHPSTIHNQSIQHLRRKVGLAGRLSANYQLGLRRPLSYTFGLILLVSAYYAIENTGGIVDEQIGFFGLQWSSRLLLRAFTSNFVIFLCKKLYCIFQPFSAPSLSQPLFMLPLIDEIVDGSLFRCFD